MLEFLVSSNNIASKLRNQYVFIIIPCLNPDGVVFGNYRVNISGYDLNRQWENPSEDFHPEILAMKSLLSTYDIGSIKIFCDIHCHSRKLNSFFYGCNTAANGGITSWTKT